MPVTISAPPLTKRTAIHNAIWLLSPVCGESVSLSAAALALGNPREVVTRMLKYFVGEGAVKLSRGTVEIIDEDILAKIAGR